MPGQRPPAGNQCRYVMVPVVAPRTWQLACRAAGHGPGTAAVAGHGRAQRVGYGRRPLSTTAVAVRPFTMQARTTFALVAPASTRLQLVIDTHARGVMGLLLPLLRGRFRKTMVRSLRLIKEEAEAEASPT